MAVRGGRRKEGVGKRERMKVREEVVAFSSDDKRISRLARLAHAELEVHVRVLRQELKQ